MSPYVRAARRLTIRCAVIGGLASLPVISQSPPRNIFGTYGQPSAGRDSIRVAERSNGKVGVAILLYYTNGHTCRLNRDGDWLDDHVTIVAEGLDASRPCRLSAYFDKGRILLKDEGLQCAPVYCGTRGKLDHVSLPKAGLNRK